MHDHPSQTVASEIAGRQPFHEALGGWRRISPVLPPEDYLQILTRAGFAEQIVRPMLYLHTMPDAGGIVEWMKGSLLTDYKRRMPLPLFDQFVDQYRERLVAVLPGERPFVFPFKRILCWARMDSHRVR